MGKRSAGVLAYRRRAGEVEVLLVHPGGPFWANKDLGAWSIPKGEYLPGDDAFEAALREFEEETGHRLSGPFAPLAPRKQPSGKVIAAWAAETDWEPSALVSNTFSMEWPKGSGKQAEFPEVDRAGWFGRDEALRRILPGQRGFVEELFAALTSLR